MSAYYNEIEPFAAQWLRNLINAGLLPDGEVDERSIVDVRSDDLRGFSECHFFAGIGGWPYALRLAGYDRPGVVWTGSCPCQPLSCAGKQLGHADERHLWPAFHRLIAERAPATVFGEQVASAIGREWLAGVRADLEELGYAVGAADLCAAGVGAPHIRQRLYWCAVADACGDGQRQHAQRDGEAQQPEQRASQWHDVARLGDLGDSERTRLEGYGWNVGDRDESRRLNTQSQRSVAATGVRIAVGYSESLGRRGRPNDEDEGRRQQPFADPCAGSFWSDAEWLIGADGKARRVKSGVRLLVDGASGRVGRLRGYGNAVVPQVAAEFIAAAMECAP